MRIRRPEREAMLARGLVAVGNVADIVMVQETGEVVAGVARWHAIGGRVEDIQTVHTHDPPTPAGTVAEGLYRDGRSELWLVRFIVNDRTLVRAIQLASNWHNPDDFDWYTIASAVRDLSETYDMRHLGMPDYHVEPFLAAEAWEPEHDNTPDQMELL